MNLTLDYMLANHCAPTLSGLKPANLIAYAVSSSPFNDPRFEETQVALGTKHIEWIQLCQVGGRELALVINRKMLEKHMAQPQVWGFLFFHGYPMYRQLDAIIDHLKQRVLMEGDFPHEVGAFLGYPIEDVMGFIKNKGQNCKACGYWKVYGDTQLALKQFDLFTKSREILCNRLKEGQTIAQIVMNT